MPSSTASLTRQAILLVNTKSRRGAEWFSDAQVELGNHGIQLRSARSFRTVDQLVREARSAVHQRVPLLIAGGGDGTFNALADVLVGSQTVLGVLPLGTGNAFARDLGIPANLDEACRIAANGPIRAVDLGVANGSHFVNVATIGLSTAIAESLTTPMKRRLGRMVYVVAVMRALREARPFRALLETENGTTEFESLQVVIGNGRYHAGPFPVSPEASIVEGKLSVYALATATKTALLRLVLALPSGRQGSLAEVHAESTKGGRLVTRPILKVTTDGEQATRTPLVFASVPAAISVRVGDAFEEITAQA